MQPFSIGDRTLGGEVTDADDDLTLVCVGDGRRHQLVQKDVRLNDNARKPVDVSRLTDRPR